MDVVEKMDTWDVMDIVEKMKNWDTWDAMVKDLRPYLVDVFERARKNDESIIQDFYFLELLIQTRVTEESTKAINQLLHSIDPYDKAYNDVVADIMKLHPNRDKLNDVLETHLQLSDSEKYGIREDWKKHARETQGDENLVVVVEDSKMVDYFKAKCDQLVNIRAKIEPSNILEHEIHKFRFMIYNVRGLISVQKIFNQTSSELHNKHKERLQNIWPVDNSCSSST